MRRTLAFLDEQRGAAAAEFALVLPGMLFLLFGVINLCLVLYAAASLHSAVQQSARYAATQTNATGSDPGSSAVTTYAAGRYLGPSISASFSYSTTGSCSPSSAGHQVSGTGNFNLFFGFGSVTVPLNATACFSS
jgi:Flp pilus assembly protein TadG